MVGANFEQMASMEAQFGTEAGAVNDLIGHINAVVGNTTWVGSACQMGRADRPGPQRPLSPGGITLGRVQWNDGGIYHLMVYVFVNAVLVIIDRRVDTGGGVLSLDWAYWVILGWGLGLAGHAISVFFGDHRVQKMYEQEKNRDLEGR